MARIVVTPAEEDEVIFAGGGADGAAGRELEPGSSAEPEHDAADAREFAAAAEPGSGRAAEPEPEAEGATAASPEPSPAAAFRETTLDDLESSPMPFAQRVVIVAAVVCIIGALVYYFVAMR